MEALDRIIDKVTHLPPFPRNVPQLLEALGEPDVDADRVVSLIQYDPALTANVMRLCNSVIFGGARPANDLHEAVLRVGLNEVYQLVLAVSCAKMLGLPQKGYGLDPGELWKHSVATAVAAKLLAVDRGDDPNLVFTAGILHDIGKVVLASALETTYGELIRDIEQQQHSLLEAEKKVLGVQHAEVGGRVLARWKFSAGLVASVWFHHDPLLASTHSKLASYVYVGNMIAYFLGQGYGHLAFAMRGRAESLELLEIAPSDLPNYMIRTVEGLKAVEGLLSLGS